MVLEGLGEGRRGRRRRFVGSADQRYVTMEHRIDEGD